MPPPRSARLPGAGSVPVVHAVHAGEPAAGGSSPVAGKKPEATSRRAHGTRLPCARQAAHSHSGNRVLLMTTKLCADMYESYISDVIQRKLCARTCGIAYVKHVTECFCTNVCCGIAGVRVRVTGSCPVDGACAIPLTLFIPARRANVRLEHVAIAVARVPEQPAIEQLEDGPVACVRQVSRRRRVDARPQKQHERVHHLVCERVCEQLEARRAQHALAHHGRLGRHGLAPLGPQQVDGVGLRIV
eukprot:78823-Chlamydomonas_euryale.AAC.8